MMRPESLLLRREATISQQDLERNKRFTENFLKLILSYEKEAGNGVSARNPGKQKSVQRVRRSLNA